MSRRSSTLTELVPSVSEPENLNELGLAAAENPEFHFVETKEDSDTEVGGGVLLSAGEVLLSARYPGVRDEGGGPVAAHQAHQGYQGYLQEAQDEKGRAQEVKWALEDN